MTVTTKNVTIKQYVTAQINAAKSWLNVSLWVNGRFLYGKLTYRRTAFALNTSHTARGCIQTKGCEIYSNLFAAFRNINVNTTPITKIYTDCLPVFMLYMTETMKQLTVNGGSSCDLFLSCDCGYVTWTKFASNSILNVWWPLCLLHYHPLPNHILTNKIH